MESKRDYLKGRVLDFGCGTPQTCQQPQPYRDLVEGEYLGIDEGDYMPGGWFDAVMCNQVLQYCENAIRTLKWNVFSMLRSGGHLVLTYPTNWDWVEENDLWRFTKAGMTHLLEDADFNILAHDLRATVRVGNFNFPLGYGVVAQKA